MCFNLIFRSQFPLSALSLLPNPGNKGCRFYRGYRQTLVFCKILLLYLTNGEQRFMAESKPQSGGLALFYGWDKRVVHNDKKTTYSITYPLFNYSL